jgi:hypothetical protein
LDIILEMASEWHQNYQTLYIPGPYVHQLIGRQFPHLVSLPNTCIHLLCSMVLMQSN